MVSTAGSVGVEVATLDAVASKPLARRGVSLDISGRGDVIGGDRVAELEQNAGIGDVTNRVGFSLHTVEDRQLADIGGGRIPGEGFTLGGLQLLPTRATVEDVGVALGVHLSGDGRSDDLLDLLGGGPQIGQTNLAAVRGGGQHIVVEIDVHGASDRVDHHQRRAGQVVHLDVGADATLEVTVAGEYCRDGQIVLVDGGRDLGDERTSVTDTGGAAVADQVESHGSKVLGESGSLKVVGDNLGARGQRGLDPRLRR